MFQPNYQNIEDCAYNRKPARIPLYDHNVDARIIERIVDQPLCRYYAGAQQDLDAYFETYCNFFRDYGYDVVTYEFCVTDILPYGGALSNTRPGYIDGTEKFEAYPWDCVKDLYIRNAEPYFNALRAHMPQGMKAIGGVGNGVFEIVQDLVGYENLCIFSFEERTLYENVFRKAGALLVEIWDWFLQNYADRYCVCRFGDDLGYKSNTLLSHEDIRQLIIPEYAKIVKKVHAAGKPFLLHSCGNIFAVMDDLIADVKIDAKHSNEDQIAPMARWVEEYGGAIGNFGGIDTDALVRMENEQLISYIQTIYALAAAKAGGFAIGSGNSIPAYVDPEKYLLMLQTVRKLRGDTL